ncbi:MAG TPA: hypothetical protein PKX92_02265 [Edaphocola sp.]|nr:hypothetical protein [Edaphocola sp.]
MKKATFFFLLLFFCFQSHGQSYWQGMGLTFNQDPMCMYFDSVTEKSYLAGNFQIVNGDSVNIMVYDGNNFTAMPKAPIHSIRSIISYKSKIFVAGFGGLASWDGNTWTWIDSISTFFNIETHGNKLYVMGWQNNNRVNLPISAVIMWNDTVWTDLLGIDTVFGNWGGLVTDIEFYKGKVYVGGNWFNPSRPELHDLMVHDGISWKPVGYFGGDGMGGVHKFLVWRDTLYVAGMFLESPIIPSNSIAAWDGAQWHRLQQGVRSNSTGGGAISAMTIYNNELWVEGVCFTSLMVGLLPLIMAM